MWLGRVASFLLHHSAKIGAAVVIMAGLMWFLAPKEEPLNLLQSRCKEQQLTLRVIELTPGSPEEVRFMRMVPPSNRERVGDGHWAFCRANLTLVPREGVRP
jgi:hypothetical protein